MDRLFAPNNYCKTSTLGNVWRASCKAFGGARSLFNSVALLSQLQECTKNRRQPCVVGFGHEKGHQGRLNCQAFDGVHQIKPGTLSCIFMNFNFMRTRCQRNYRASWLGFRHPRKHLDHETIAGDFMSIKGNKKDAENLTSTWFSGIDQQWSAFCHVNWLNIW